MTEYRRKLIEVALPLDAINAASQKEKQPFTRKHPRSLHIWWARRPLAACRAVLFAQLVDDPSSHPDEFPTEELQDAERQRLFGIIEELVKWENTTNEEVLNAARAEILKSTGGNPPSILDPFAGGGSIPLEAQRLGLEAHASDLNPVAVLINKALIEIPPEWADLPPVHPDAEQRTHWKGAEGLAEDVRLYGKWMRDEAQRRIGHLYPMASLEDGTEANVSAWLWARTVTCPNPACQVRTPLIRSAWLSKRPGREAWIKPIVDRNSKTCSYSIRRSGLPKLDASMNRQGATCVACSTSIPFADLRAIGKAHGFGTDLIAVAIESTTGKGFADPLTVPTIDVPNIQGPAGNLPEQALGFRVQAYGFSRYADLFTQRQLVAMQTLTDLVVEATSRIETDSDEEHSIPRNASRYNTAVATFLALGVSRWADIGNSFTSWNSTNGSIRALFARQSIPMVWDFAEANPLSTGVSWYSIFSRAIEYLSLAAVGVPGDAHLLDARVPRDAPRVVATDPPYYDNIGYADLSDFFYVWLRSSMGNQYPELFQTILSPKADELISTPFRHEDSRDRADKYFEDGFVQVFGSLIKSSATDFPMSLFYAFKQSESDSSDGLGSTGWSTMLEGLLSAGWSVTATWPMRTERGARAVALGTNALASSVVLACRPRDESVGLTDRQGFLRALRGELPASLNELQKAHILPVDLRQAAIGPGMAVFSRYSRVVEPDGGRMSVRTALGLINQVLDQVLGEQEASFDPETRWAIQWFSQFFEDEGPYGVAESLATSMAIAVDAMVGSGILSSGGGKVRLLGRKEYPDDWDPTTDTRTPVWEACQHLVKRLEEQGEAAAGELLSQLGGLGESAQLLAYRLYTICEQTRPNLAGPYNALVASWLEIQQHAATSLSVNPRQQSFDE